MTQVGTAFRPCVLHSCTLVGTLYNFQTVFYFEQQQFQNCFLLLPDLSEPGNYVVTNMLGRFAVCAAQIESVSVCRCVVCLMRKCCLCTSGLNVNLTENCSLSTHMERNQKENLVINAHKLNINYLLGANSICNYFYCL